jgi:L-fuconolactonase
MCKLSGVITEANHAHWNRAQLRPYLEHAIESFGFERVIFASDWPVSEQTHRYAEWVAILDELTATCSADERRRLFRDNAIACYRLR